MEKICNAVDQLRNLLVDVSELCPDPANARLHSRGNIEAIKTSLSKLGQHVPIVVQKEGMIVRVGNARLTAAKELGWTHIAAVIIDENNVDAVARAVADNRTAEMSHWDYDVLEEVVQALDQEGWGDGLKTFWTETELHGFGIDQTAINEIDIVDPTDDGEPTGFAEGHQFKEKNEVFMTGPKEVLESEGFLNDLAEFCSKHDLKYKVR